MILPSAAGSWHSAAVSRSRVCLAVALVCSSPAAAGAAPGRAGLVWPAPARPRLRPCAAEQPLTGTGLLITGGALAGVGLIPLISGAVAAANYEPCDPELFFCQRRDGAGRMGVGGALIGLGTIFLVVGGVWRYRYKHPLAALVRPHVGRTPGGGVVGVQLRF